MSDTELVKFLAHHGVRASVVEVDEDLEDFLAHYGVKGMKWGVRRSEAELARSRGVRKDRVASKVKKNSAGIADIVYDKVDKTEVPVARFTKAMSQEVANTLAEETSNLHAKVIKEFKDNASEKQRALNEEFAGVFARVNAGNDPIARNKAQISYNRKFAKILDDFVSENTPEGYSARALIYHDRPDMYVVLGGSKAVKKLAKQMPGLLVKHADEDLEPVGVLRIKPTRDKDGLITSIEAEDASEEDLTHSDDIDNFLAHYGVKGMKWGVRRSQAQLDRAAGRDGGSSGTKKRAKGLKGVVEARRERKEAKARETLEKAARRVASTTPEISADAERFVKTSMKAGASMSDQEIKKYLERARLVKEYEQLTSKPTKSQAELLKEQYEIMNYTKKMSDLKREMTPKKVSKVDKFVKRAGQAYAAYTVVDGWTGGDLSKKLGGDLMDIINGTGKIHVQETRSAPNRNRPKGGKRKRSKSDNQVYNITSLGR